MKRSDFEFADSRCLSLTLLLLLSFPLVGTADDECDPSGEYAFVCGPKNAEDLVHVPDTKWIISSGMGPDAAIYLINSQQKIWTELYPADAPRAQQDMENYGACPGSPDPNHFVTHGLNIRPGADGHSTLYVVGHGGREAIEVFDVDANGEMPYANGIEVSADGREFYVASSGLFTVAAYSNSNPARQLRSSKPFAFVPDNLHMGSDGMLLTAGLNIVDPVCGDVPQSDEFDLEKFASCPRPFTVLAIDPQSMQGKTLASGSAYEHFSNITMALSVGGELWIGTFEGDRIAYRSLKQVE
jgi:hypothetical protein